ncbi:four-carbon acid sugar kinase family protein [Galactobacillus timonensis]|uniref:four-carbon acid sugar kinase family protein n=1 Tax=Galactobacillus timonensis TaxID=2041840 RepID=UPI00240A561B|nr:four-carbon acid sugar kinase family protein [Galactobacillus timonensis]MDD6679646.1 four-carbon acid sugar kinase family protein [Galactobacillus timonensis]
MSEETLSASVLSSFPFADERKLDVLLQAALSSDHEKFIVLDDDPTGVQTVHDVHVYTHWDVDSIRQGLGEDSRIFYILTNSRGMTEDETTRIHREILANAQTAANEIPNHPSYSFISRSDSTLRGHFPLETEILREGMEKNGICVDGEILIPFFKEGGRFTIHNTHYIKYGDKLVPSAETEFAKDPTFGYTHSDLPAYIEEKTGGRYPAKDVVCISLDDLRAWRIGTIEQQLMHVHGFNKVIVNAVDYCDLEVFCIALCHALKQGKHFLYRTAASFVKVIGGISDRPLLTHDEMIHSSSANGGIIVVGSHTEKTTSQLKELLKLPDIVPVEFESSTVLAGEDAFNKEVERCLKEEEAIIAGGKTAVAYTERTLLSLPDDTKESALIRSVKISDGVQRLVRDLSITPAFVIAKGGITSADVGVKALGVKRALVLGQIQPGIPVWQTDPDSRFPGNPYIIFPGNVGEADTLRKSVEVLQNH